MTSQPCDIYIYIRNMKPYNWRIMKTIEGLPQAAPKKSHEAQSNSNGHFVTTGQWTILQSCRQWVNHRISISECYIKELKQSVGVCATNLDKNRSGELSLFEECWTPHSGRLAAAAHFERLVWNTVPTWHWGTEQRPASRSEWSLLLAHLTCSNVSEITTQVTIYIACSIQ